MVTGKSCKSCYQAFDAKLYVIFISVISVSFVVWMFLAAAKCCAKTLRELVRWMDGEGMATDHLKAMDWENFDVFQANQADIDVISVPIEAFFKTHGRNEISAEAARRSISICPCLSVPGSPKSAGVARVEDGHSLHRPACAARRSKP